jgi:hypothetical protein
MTEEKTKSAPKVAFQGARGFLAEIDRTNSEVRQSFRFIRVN